MPSQYGTQTVSAQEGESIGGGPSAEQRQAAASQTALDQQQAQIAAQRQKQQDQVFAKTMPFYGNLMDNGNPYFHQATDFASGTNARAYAPAKAALIRRLGTSTGLPDGYRDQALTDFEEQRAQGFDNNLLNLEAENEAAKERGAAGMMGQAQAYNPEAYFQGAEQGNNSILQAQSLTRPGFAGTLGALIGAGAQLGRAAMGH